jgi:hypothetical protein
VGQLRGFDSRRTPCVKSVMADYIKHAWRRVAEVEQVLGTSRGGTVGVGRQLLHREPIKLWNGSLSGWLIMTRHAASYSAHCRYGIVKYGGHGNSPPKAFMMPSPMEPTYKYVPYHKHAICPPPSTTIRMMILRRYHTVHRSPPTPVHSSLSAPTPPSPPQHHIPPGSS